MLPKNAIFTSHIWLPILRWLTKHCLHLPTLLFFVFASQYSIGQTTNFTSTPINGNFCAPSPIKFQATFSETPISYYWQFGIPGEESDESSPTFIYTIPGSYKVTLTVLFSNSIQEVKKDVTVYGPPNFKIVPNKSFACNIGAIDFQVSGTQNLNNLLWDFGDNRNSPSDTVASISHNYVRFGNFKITLSGKDQRGCKGSDTTSVIIQMPTAVLFDSVIIPCVPVNVLFQTDVSMPSGGTVTSYLWDFNDGTPSLTTSTNSVQHVFNSVNTFTPKVSIVTSDGCNNTFTFKPLTTGIPPSNTLISKAKDSICASEVASFSGFAKDADNYLWQVSDGTEIFTSGNNFNHQFNALGNFSVKLTPYNSGCPGPSDSLQIHVRGVIAGFRFTNDCMDKSIFNFRSNSLGVVNSYKWYFNDTILGSTIARPTNKFDTIGRFDIRLIINQNSTGCADTFSNTIFTAKPKLAPADSFVCIGQRTSMMVNGTYTNPATRYNWNLGGRAINNGRDTLTSIIVNTGGVFSNRLIITNGAGYCQDTLYQFNNLRVGNPKVDINFVPIICFNDSFKIENLTQKQFPDVPIVEWIWDFGNGTTSRLEKPEPITYASAGIYIIKLKAMDSKGCSDSIGKEVIVQRLPIVKLLAPDSKVCQGSNVTLEALHNGSVFWSPSNLFNCDTCSKVIVNPIQPTSYELVVMDTSGCKSSQSFALAVWEDFALDSNLLRDTGICINNSVQFDLQLNNRIINWSPSTGLSSINIPNPIATPLNTTTYTASISDSAGCFTKTLSSIVEVNPLPVIAVGPDLYMPFNTPFTIRPTYSTRIISYNWQPAGLLSCNNCPEPSGIALGTNTFTVIATSDKGCIDSASILVSIECTEDNIMMPNAFTPNNDGLNDFFYPITKGKPTVTRFIIYNRMGEQVFQRYNFEPNNRILGWDGTYKGKAQPTGSFIYILETECYQGASTSKKGNFTLLR